MKTKMIHDNYVVHEKNINSFIGTLKNLGECSLQDISKANDWSIPKTRCIYYQHLRNHPNIKKLKRGRTLILKYEIDQIEKNAETINNNKTSIELKAKMWDMLWPIMIDVVQEYANELKEREI